MDFLKFWGTMLGWTSALFGWVAAQLFAFQWFIDLTERYDNIFLSMLTGLIGLSLLTLNLSLLFYKEH